MHNRPDDPTSIDRRPIAARRVRLFRKMAMALAAAGVSPDAVSVVGMIFGCGAGVCLALTEGHDTTDRVLFLLSAGFVQLRLLANLLDGLVAVEGGRGTAVGDLYNEVPDRISDAVILVGAGYAATSFPTLGWAAALAACFVAYTRLVGRSVGLAGDYRGPMAKQQRMFLVTVGALVLACSPAAWFQPSNISTSPPVLGLMAIVLIVIVLGSVVTAMRRLLGIARALRART